MKATRFLLLLCIAMTFTVSLAAQISLTVTKPNTTDVALNWTGGTSPYTVSRSSRPDFFISGTTLLAQSTSATTYTYLGAQQSSQTVEYFSVGDTANPPAGVGGGLPDPPVQPIITTISSVSGTDSQTISITGQGFSDIPAENIVLVDGYSAVADTAAFSGFAAGNATTITVKVPVGATSGYVRVLVRGIVSNPAAFSVTIDDPAAPFTWSHIRSMAYDAPTHGLLVSDGTGSNKIYTLVWNAGTKKWVRTQVDAQTNAVLSHRDSAGYYYTAGTGALSVSRLPFTGPSTLFDNKCPAATATAGGIREVGARETETDTVYCGYVVTTPATMPNHVARKVLSGTQDFDYGNLGTAAFTFPSNGSIVFDKAGNLFLTEKTQITRITPAEAVSVVKTGFTNLTGLDWIGRDASDPGYLVVVDRGANKLFVLDLSRSPVTMDEIKPTVPFNSPASAVFGFDPELQASVLYVAEDPASPMTAKRIVRYRDPRFDRVSGDKPLTLLISKQEVNDKFPEQSWQSADGEIIISFKIIPTPAVGTTVYARAIDPADTAASQHLSANLTGGCAVSSAIPGQTCDNGDQTYGFGSASLLRTTSAVTDANGVASFTLKMSLDTTKRFSGDNYRVQISFDNFATAPSPLVVGQSTLITAWKRIYLQRGVMYREGGLLNFTSAGTTDNFPNVNVACTNKNLVIDPNYDNLILDCPSYNCTGLGVPIVLFDKDHQIGSGKEQYRSIVAIGKPTSGCGSGAILLTLDADLSTSLGTYYAGVDGSATHRGAGIGVIGLGKFATTWPDKRAFDQAFSEFVPNPTGDVDLPYAGTLFFNACDKDPNTDPVWQQELKWRDLWGDRKKNHLFISHIESRVPSATSGTVACTWSPARYTSMQVLSCQSDATTCTATPSLALYETHICSHECGHHFSVNGCGSSGGHDTRCDWLGNCASPLFVNNCIMNLPGTACDRINSRRLFDNEDLLLSDTTTCSGDHPETTIRRNIDPLPQ